MAQWATKATGILDKEFTQPQPNSSVLRNNSKAPSSEELNIRPRGEIQAQALSLLGIHEADKVLEQLGESSRILWFSAHAQ